MNDIRLVLKSMLIKKKGIILKNNATVISARLTQEISKLGKCHLLGHQSIPSHSTQLFGPFSEYPVC